MTGKVPLRVALLTNFIPPYFLPVLQNLSHSVGELRVFLSTRMEANRSWMPAWDGLQVTVQRGVTIRRRWKHKEGFSDQVFVHLPVDTLALLRNYRPDVVVSAGLGLRTLLACLYRHANPRTRLVGWINCSEHTEIGVSKLRSALRRSLLRSPDTVLTNGPSGSRYLQSLGVQPSEIVCLPYVRDMSSLLSIAEGRDELASRRLLFVGQLTERKGMQHFVPALIRWQRQNQQRALECWIVGDGPLKEELRRMAAAGALDVKFLGHIDFAQLPSVYAQAGLLVFPTLADEWGLVVNEALAAGLPVLGSRFSQAVEELVQEARNGWIFSPDQPKQLDAVLDRALSCPPANLLRMRQAARLSVLHLTPELAAGRMLDAIQMALSN